MAKLPTASRQCSGSYTVEAHGRTITVCRVDEWQGPAKWHWRDEYAAYCYGDPVMTKREAVEGAVAYAASRAADPDAWR